MSFINYTNTNSTYYRLHKHFSFNCASETAGDATNENAKDSIVWNRVHNNGDVGSELASGPGCGSLKNAQFFFVDPAGGLTKKFDSQRPERSIFTEIYVKV